METVKIDLGDGDYALVYKAYKHKTAAAINELLLAALTPDMLKALQAEPDIAKRTAILKPLNIKGEDTTTLVNQTASLYFDKAEQLISPQSFGELSETKYQLLLSEVNKLYSPTPLPPSK